MVGLDARESDTHSRIGNGRYDTTERSECDISLKDFDPKLGAFRWRVLRVNEAPADTEFTGPGGALRIRADIRHFRFDCGRITAGYTDNPADSPER